MSALPGFRRSLDDLPVAKDVPADWTAEDEARYVEDGLELDAEEYADYVLAGGTRSFEDWVINPCVTCSPRHPSSFVEFSHRPEFTIDRADLGGQP